MGTINETNAQYYSGQSIIKSTNAGNSNVFEFGFCSCICIASRFPEQNAQPQNPQPQNPRLQK